MGLNTQEIIDMFGMDFYVRIELVSAARRVLYYLERLQEEQDVPTEIIELLTEAIRLNDSELGIPTVPDWLKHGL